MGYLSASSIIIFKVSLCIDFKSESIFSDCLSISITNNLLGFSFSIDLVKLPGPGPISIMVVERGFDFETILSVKF